MFGSFFQYLSWFGYMFAGLGFVSVVVLVVSLARLVRADVSAKPEKALRYTGFCVLMVTMIIFVVFMDWAFSHDLVIKDGRPVRDIPESSAMILFYIVIPLSVVYTVLLAIAWLLKRKRENRATDEHVKMYITLYEEYGPEEARRLMEQAGHDKVWLDTFKNYI